MRSGNPRASIQPSIGGAEHAAGAAAASPGIGRPQQEAYVRPVSGAFRPEPGLLMGNAARPATLPCRVWLAIKELRAAASPEGRAQNRAAPGSFSARRVPVLYASVGAPKKRSSIMTIRPWSHPSDVPARLLRHAIRHCLCDLGADSLLEPPAVAWAARRSMPSAPA
jgi:hypothetical protein